MPGEAATEPKNAAEILERNRKAADLIQSWLTDEDSDQYDAWVVAQLDDREDRMRCRE